MNSGNLTQNSNISPSRVAIIISPNFGNYAQQHLSECIKSIEGQKFRGSAKVFLTDNESSEDSYGFLSRCVPDARIIRCEENSGFAGGNNLAMQAAIDEGYDYLLLINMDTIVAPDCISSLLSLAQRTPLGAAFQARLMLWPDQKKINSTGNQTHFLGFGFCGEFGEEYADDMRARRIAHPSGAAVLLRADAVEGVGLFDEHFWMYCEDLDLGWRLWLAGYECWYSPEAVVYHKYAFLTGPDKFYWLDRNRIISILKNYHLATLILIFPAFLLMEFGTMLHAVSNGWFLKKISVWGWLMSPSHLRQLFRSRQRTQNLRRSSDRDIVKIFRGKVDFGPIDSLAIRGANMVLSTYWFLVKNLIFW